MRNLTEIPTGSFLTAEESAAMVAASTLTGKDRYSYSRNDAGSWGLWDYEEADWVANAAGETELTERDARDLWLEYISA